MVRAQGKKLGELLAAVGAEVPLIGVVHEVLEDEPTLFKETAFAGKGEILYDPEKAFFPEENQGALGLLRAGSMMNIARFIGAGGGAGSAKGAYNYHGGVLVFGPEDQGVLYQSLELDFGDLANSDEITAAIASLGKLEGGRPAEQKAKADEEPARARL